MRIALVAPLVTPIAQPFIGGSQAMVADLAMGMAQRGHQVTLFAREGSSVPGVHIEPVVVPEHVTPSSFAEPGKEQSLDPGFMAQANVFFELYLQLRQRAQEFDIIHAHAFDWPSFACSTLITTIPVLHTVHLPAILPEINNVLSVLERQQHPVSLLTVSQACARDYAAYCTFDHVIYNGLDIEAIPFSPRVAPDAPLLFAGRITPEKGVEQAIEIAEQAGRRLIVAGGIYDRRYHEERVLPRIAQKPEQFTYVGQLDHTTLWKLMSEVQGLLFPIAWDEPFGLTLVEAMATGTPVIAFQRGAMPEIIQDGQTGFLVPPEDCFQAAQAVQRLPLLSRERCRAHAEAKFSLQRMLDDHEEVYQRFAR
ncbi:glycosyltransferase family 4 protein [Dictyobacter formicarum]|uniref:Glycosyl transferase n=1 Tax=Dictyobacter formicarum TaxID=2778368 RepID=A0ABQ3VMH7_9CHLR|nr:glycosyltransferase family 4 protein [Dictyobacter formicarum]GHO86886.1 glycosyl transferase [Dictyobacter formicarum]